MTKSALAALRYDVQQNILDIGQQSYVNWYHREVSLAFEGDSLLLESALQVDYGEEPKPFEATDDAVESYLVQQQMEA